MQADGLLREDGPFVRLKDSLQTPYYGQSYSSAVVPPKIIKKQIPDGLLKQEFTIFQELLAMTFFLGYRAANSKEPLKVVHHI